MSVVSSRSSRWTRASFVAGLAWLAFLVCGTVVEFHLFPYRQLLSPSFEAARALRNKWGASPRNSDFWRKTDHVERGLVSNDPSAAFPGYTIYSATDNSGARLLDMDGHVVHEWQVPFRAAWPVAPHVANPVPESRIFWRRVHLFPNGDLLALYEAAGETPWGYGLIKVDRDSHVLWTYSDRVHHDLEVDGDGTIVTLAHEWRNTKTRPLAGFPDIAESLLEDFVVRLAPDGKVLSRVSVLEALARSPFADALRSVEPGEWDVLHSNAVEIVTPEFAARHAGEFRAGEILISMRSRNMIAAYDPATETFEWAACGPYRWQHDPDVMPDGSLLLFDNRGNPGPGGPSRIIEFDPVAQTVRWSWSGTAAAPFRCLLRGSQQPLPNGDVLVTDSDGCRIVEVARSGRIVWEYRVPGMLDGDPTLAPVVGDATRIPRDDIRFTPHSEPSSRDPHP